MGFTIFVCLVLIGASFAIGFATTKLLKSNWLSVVAAIAMPPFVLYLVLSADPQSGGWAEVGTFFGSFVAIPMSLVGCWVGSAHKKESLRRSTEKL